jgi:hypothetical protein
MRTSRFSYCAPHDVGAGARGQRRLGGPRVEDAHGPEARLPFREERLVLGRGLVGVVGCPVREHDLERHVEVEPVTAR